MRAMSSGGVLVNNKRAVGSEPVMRWALPRSQARLAKLLSEIVETVTAKVGSVNRARRIVLGVFILLDFNLFDIRFGGWYYFLSV